MTFYRSALAAISTLILSSAVPSLALAQAPGNKAAPWRPDRPVTIVVPYSAGGGTDATARVIAKHLSTTWKQPVLVENQPGAEGLIGTRRVMDAKPDGTTLVMQIPALLLTKHLPELKGIDPLTQLTPVTAIAQYSLVIVANPKLPVTTLAELFAYCKSSAKPAPCSAGAGETTSRIAAQRLADVGGLRDLVVAHYRGTSGVVTDVIGGSLTLGYSGLTAALPQAKAGKLRVLAVLGDTRSKYAPDIPTAAEAGLSDSVFNVWFALFAPQGAPPRVVSAIADAVRLAKDDADVQKALATIGAEPLFSAPSEFARVIAAEDKALTSLVKRYPLQ